MPPSQAIDLYSQQLDLIPRLQLLHAVVQVWGDPANPLAERIQAGALHLLEGSLLNNHPGLEIFAAVNQHQDLPVVHISKQLLWIARVTAEAEPEYVDGNSEFRYRQLRSVPNQGVTAIAAHHQIGSNLHHFPPLPHL